MPLRLLALLLGAKVLRVQLLGLDGRNNADLVVLVLLAGRVHDWVDVQPGGLRLAGQLAEALDKLLLEVVGDVILLPEEDDAALGDCDMLDRRSSTLMTIDKGD